MATREISRRDSKKSAPLDSRQRAGNSPCTQSASDTVVSEMAELLRELHQSLQDYAPVWYTEEMDDRIRETLAAAERA